MALYAFDGTWNEDEENPTADTNVVHFRDAYEGPVEYRQGVGTRLGVLGRMAGGLFGAGGRSRIEEMYNAARTNWLAGDRVIDIVGFSRGAALAVHFANLVAGHGLKLPDGLVVQAPVRFLGVWDIVGSFGLPVNFLIDFQGINLGWTIDRVPQAVECCRHAMALDERRQTFGVTRLSAGPNVEELWFRGVHSDVGGGNTNIARSNLALAWMLEEGKAAGLPIARATIDDVAATANRHARVSSNLDIVRNRRRARHETDQHHPSAVADTLAPGQSATFPVRSSDHYNWTGVRAEQGATYRVEVPGDQRWVDGGISATADGWTSAELPFLKEALVRSFELRRRAPRANWFQLVLTLDDDDQDVYPVGTSGQFVATRDADLWAFANDLKEKYGNNKGELLVTVTRVS